MKDTLVKTQMLRSLAVAILFLSLSFSVAISSPLANAQTTHDIELQVDAEVSSLLSEIESKQASEKVQYEGWSIEKKAAKQISVYNRSTKRKISTVSQETPFAVTSNQPNWVLARFNQAVIKGWVSQNFVNTNDDIATVRVAILNLRNLPSTSSMIIDRLPRGYSSKVIARKDGFVQIFAPKSLVVALKKTDLENTNLLPEEVATKLAPEVISAQTPIKTETEKSLTNDVESSHIIAPGDAISLLVFGEKDLSVQNVRVPQGGQISLPLIGALNVSGKTTTQVEKDIFDLLSQGYVRNPRLSVSIFSYRPIFIRGAVRQTGSFPFTAGLTIAKAIALAGGSKNSANKQGVSILREGTIVLDSLAIDSQVKISSGDVISVSEEFGVSEDQATYVYLHGEVASPGEYLYRRGLTVEKAVVLAGGFTLRASRKKVSVTRYIDKEQGEEPQKLKKVRLYTPIQPGDIIDVGASWF